MKKSSNDKLDHSNQKKIKKTPFFKKSINKKLEQNKTFIKERLGNSTDIIIREFKIGPNPKTSVALFYTDGLTDIASVQKFIMESLLFEFKEVEIENNHANRKPRPLLEQLKDLVLTTSVA